MLNINAIIRGTKVEPRQYQRTIVDKCVSMFSGNYRNGLGDLEPPMRSVMIEAPTGSGKTVMAFVTARILQSIVPDLVIGWVAMRRDLLRQASLANKRLGLNIENIHFISMFNSNPEELLTTKRGGKPLLLVADEAQHDAANSMAHLHSILEPKFVLGMTATPFRTDRVKLCFDSVVKDAGIHQLIEDGYLSRYHHYTIQNWDVENVANHYCADPERWGRSIFYFLTREECCRLRQILLERGFFPRYERALRDRDQVGIATFDPVVDGNSDRERQIDAYLNGESDKLINCMVLTEGFDDPSLKTVWVRDSSKGPTIQMAGRVFRKYPDLAFKQVVQSDQTHYPIVRTALPSQQYLWHETGWRSLKLNPYVDSITSITRNAIARTCSELPKVILEKRNKKPRTFRV
jgi:superfamily II DNA or RNA helicase